MTCRLEREKAALLVLIGALADNRKVVPAVESGRRETAASWAAVLRGLLCFDGPALPRDRCTPRAERGEREHARLIRVDESCVGLRESLQPRGLRPWAREVRPNIASPQRPPVKSQRRR